MDREIAEARQTVESHNQARAEGQKQLSLVQILQRTLEEQKKELTEWNHQLPKAKRARYDVDKQVIEANKSLTATKRKADAQLAEH